jgi:4-amino-4-deoxy-L-arabinose transferase-like glycosyltransferase
MIEDHVSSKAKALFQSYIILAILEGIIVVGTIVAFPADPKNAFYLGYSLFRLMLVGLILLLQGFLVFILINRKLNHRLNVFFFSSSSTIKLLKYLSFIVILLLCVTIWFPPGRLGKLTASYIRFRPFLLWIEIIGLQTYFLIKVLNQEINTSYLLSFLKNHKKSFLLIGLLLLFFAVVFFLLTRYAPKPEGLQYYFPPGAPLSGLQVFLSWTVFFLLYLRENRTPKCGGKSRWTWGIVIFIWMASFILWNSTPISCTDDRLGPFPPNDTCYAQINDAVYSIGSHYITLGQGIYNHWLTDKPFYMIFLAIGQWVSGPAVDQYITFQILILALIPVSLFLIGKKLTGLSGGFLLATLATLLEFNSIWLYSLVGSVNAKTENPELLTSLVLVLLFFGLFNWLRHPDHKIWAVLTGGILGLSVLIRFNPVFIAPVILPAFIWLGRKKRKSMLVGLSLFVLTFSLVFLPWFLTARDPQGNNFYFLKIQDVIGSRFTPSISSVENKIESIPENLPSPINTEVPLEPEMTPVIQVKQGVVTKGGYTSVVYHLLNNAFTSIAKLPTEISFRSITDQVSSPIRDFTTYTPLWNKTLTSQNLTALFMNVFFITIGFVTAIKRFGIAGLTGVMIQLGYFLGNAAAQTSGSRYIEPVFWVTLLYYLVGVVSCTGIISRVLFNNGGAWGLQLAAGVLSSNSNVTAAKRKAFIGPLLSITGFFLLGLSVPIFNNLPSKMLEENTPQLTQSVYSKLSGMEIVTPEQWQRFMSSPGIMVVQGVAFHPRYYRSDVYAQGSPSFEIMLLTERQVIISYTLDVTPMNYFSDGSKTILLGCRIGSDSMWAAERTFMRTYVIIQQDHEGSTYFSPDFQWTCK